MARAVSSLVFAGFVGDQKDFAAQERPLLIELQDLEAVAAFGDDVEAAVGIFLGDADDFDGASNFGDALFMGANHAEGRMVGETFADHFFVAGLEDVQGQRSSGEEDDIKRE
jgi:hypothetical protein